MDTKRLITLMIVGLALIFGWETFVRYMYEHHPEWKRPGEQTEMTTPAAAPASGPAAPTSAPALVAATVPTTESSATGATAATATPGATLSSLHILNAPAEVPAVQLGSATRNDPQYRLAIDLTARGAAVESVAFNEFNESIHSPQPYTFQRAITESGTTVRSLATGSVSINGQRIDLANAIWNLSHGSNASQATFTIDIGDDAGPVLRISKTYSLSPRSDDGDHGYNTAVTQQLTNLSPRPLTVQLVTGGTLSPPREVVMYDDRQIVAGYLARDYIAFEHEPLTQFKEGTPSKDLLTSKDKLPLLWAGADSAYFDAIVRPVPLATTQSAPGYLASVEATALNPQSPPDDRVVAMTFTSATQTLAPSADFSVPLSVFFGPKQRSLLNSGYFAQLGYDQTLSTSNSGCTNYCTTNWLITGLIWLLGAFHFVFRDWGLAIIGLVVLVRLILHPITKRSTISMQRMQKLGPEMERLKKKYGDNKEELNKAMMQFYKEQGFAPFLGCLPMFLQMPIWIALYSVLQNTFELWQAPFLYGLTWIHDLAKPDRLIPFSHSYTFFFLHIDGINLLPILMAVVFWLQQKYQPKPPTTTPEQASQQKMMQWMTLLFPLFLYSYPSGLNLYILTSTAIGIWESKRVRDHLLAQAEAEKQGRVIVDAKPTRGARRREAAPEPKKAGGLGKWLADLQARAEDMRRDTERRGRK